MVDRHPVHRAHRVQEWVAQMLNNWNYSTYRPTAPSATRTNSLIKMSKPMQSVVSDLMTKPN